MSEPIPAPHDMQPDRRKAFTVVEVKGDIVKLRFTNIAGEVAYGWARIADLEQGFADGKLSSRGYSGN